MIHLIYLVSLMLVALFVYLITSQVVQKRLNKLIEESKEKANVAEGKLSFSEQSYTKFREQEDKRSQKASEDFKELRERLSVEERARTAAERDKQNAMERLEEEKKLIANAKEELTKAFKAVAGDALSNSTKQNLEMAKQVLDKVLSDAKGDLGKRQEAISGLMKPLTDKLKDFDEHVRALETKRERAYTSVEEQLKSLTTSEQQLQREVTNLSTALKSPQIRGRWGEITLRRVIEVAGLSEHCDFDEQVHVQGEEARQRPDLVVHLPLGRQIVVDSKVPLEAFLSASDAKSEEQKKAFMINHARQVRSHMNALAEKAYQDKLPKATQSVVMFIPGEAIFAEAVHHDLTLLEDAVAKNVFIASPITLIAILRAIAFGWREELIAANAQAISDLGKQLYERMRVLADHIDGIGSGLTKANESYSKAVSSMELRVMPSARKFKELGAATGEEIVFLKPIETTPRKISLPELPGEDKPTVQ